MQQTMVSLKADLIKRLIQAAIILTTVGAIYFAASWFNGSVDQDKREIDGRISALQNEKTQLLRERGIAQEALASYEKLGDTASTELLTSIDRNAAFEFLRNLSRSLELSNPKITLEPIAAAELPAIELRDHTLVKSIIKLEFGALSDVEGYRLLAALKQQLSGKLWLSNMEITRSDKTITEGDFLKIADGGSLPDLTNHKFELHWFGMEAAAKENESDANPAGTNNAEAGFAPF